MDKIKKWLTDNGIEFEERENRWSKGDVFFVITLEKDCVWINGFGEPMKYDKKISISHPKGGIYLVDEQTGYSTFRMLGQSTRAEKAIQALEKRFLK